MNGNFRFKPTITRTSTINTSFIGPVVAGVVAFSAAASAGGNAIDQSIAAVFAPDSRPAAASSGRATEAVSLLNGIVESWRDPSHSKSTDATGDSAAMAESQSTGAVSGATTVEESLRGVFNAYSAD